MANLFKQSRLVENNFILTISFTEKYNNLCTIVMDLLFIIFILK